MQQESLRALLDDLNDEEVSDLETELRARKANGPSSHAKPASAFDKLSDSLADRLSGVGDDRLTTLHAEISEEIKRRRDKAKPSFDMNEFDNPNLSEERWKEGAAAIAAAMAEG